jgi:hypothetical protein
MENRKGEWSPTFTRARHKENQRSQYIAEAAAICINHARVMWGCPVVDVVLFRGEEGTATMHLLPDQLRLTYHVGEILDLRMREAGPDTVLYQPLQKLIYLETSPEVLNKIDDGSFDEAPARTVSEKMAHGKRDLAIHFYS